MKQQGRIFCCYPHPPRGPSVCCIQLYFPSSCVLTACCPSLCGRFIVGPCIVCLPHIPMLSVLLPSHVLSVCSMSMLQLFAVYLCDNFCPNCFCVLSVSCVVCVFPVVCMPSFRVLSLRRPSVCYSVSCPSVAVCMCAFFLMCCLCATCQSV